MGLLDKSINKAIGWNNEDISVTDMAEKIEIIMRESSEKEIRSLKSLAKKSWVLAVGGGSSIRYSHLQGEKYKVVFDYSMFTHLISTVQLYDYETKTNYFIPKGRSHARELQALITASILKCGKGK